MDFNFHSPDGLVDLWFDSRADVIEAVVPRVPIQSGSEVGWQSPQELVTEDL